MTYYAGIPVDEGEGTSFYSTNRLVNGDAETGSTSPWTVTSTTVVPGGVGNGSQFTFDISAGGSMAQTVVNSGAQPPDYLLKGAFLPSKVLNEANPVVRVYAKVTVLYGDGTYDEVVLPVRRPVVPLPNVEGGNP